jgi:hypothetical protein
MMLNPMLASHTAFFRIIGIATWVAATVYGLSRAVGGVKAAASVSVFRGFKIFETLNAGVDGFGAEDVLLGPEGTVFGPDVVGKSKFVDVYSTQ